MTAPAGEAGLGPGRPAVRRRREVPWVMAGLLLGVALIPLALFSSLAYLYARQAFQQQAQRLISNAASSQADLLDARIEHQHRLLTMGLSRPSLQDGLDKLLGAPDARLPALQVERQAIKQELQDLKQSGAWMDEFAVVLLSGRQAGLVVLASRSTWEGQVLSPGAAMLELAERAWAEPSENGATAAPGKAASQAMLNPQDFPGLTGSGAAGYSGGAGGDPELVIVTAIPWQGAAEGTANGGTRAALAAPKAALLFLAGPSAVQKMVSDERSRSAAFAEAESAEQMTLFFIIPQAQAFIGVNPNLETATKLFNFQPPQGAAAAMFDFVQKQVDAAGRRSSSEQSGAEALRLIGPQGRPELLGYVWLDSLQAGWGMQAPASWMERRLGLPDFEQIRQIGLAAFGLTALLLAIFLGVATLRLTAPLAELVISAERLAAGELLSGTTATLTLTNTVQALPPARSNIFPGLSRFSRAFAQIVEQIGSLQRGMEEQQAQQAELAQTYLQLSRSASVAASVDEFLRQALSLIVKRLGYPHAAIFVARAAGELAGEGERRSAVPSGSLALLRHSLSASESGGTAAALTLGNSAGGTSSGSSFNHPRQPVTQAIATNRAQVSPLAVQSNGGTASLGNSAASGAEASTQFQAVLPIASGSQILGALSVISRPVQSESIQSGPTPSAGESSEREGSRHFSATELTQLGALANTLALGMLQLEAVEARQAAPASGAAAGLAAATPAWETGAAGNMEVQRRLAELEALWTISQVITLETDLSRLYRTIHEQVTRFTGELSSFAIALYDGSSDQVRIPYMYEEGRYLNIPPFPLGQGLSSIVIRSGQPLVLVEDTLNKTRALGAITVGEPAKSWLGVPLRMGEETFGLIIAQDLENEQRFDEEDVRLLSAIAAQVSVVVRNARLLESSRRQAEMERLVNEITAKIRRATNAETIIRTTAEELASALGARRAQVQINLSRNKYGEPDSEAIDDAERRGAVPTQSVGTRKADRNREGDP